MKKRIEVKTVIEIIDEEIKMYRSAMNMSRRGMSDSLEKGDNLGIILNARTIENMSDQITTLERLRKEFTDYYSV